MLYGNDFIGLANGLDNLLQSLELNPVEMNLFTGHNQPRATVVDGIIFNPNQLTDVIAAKQKLETLLTTNTSGLLVSHNQIHDYELEVTTNDSQFTDEKPYQIANIIIDPLNTQTVIHIEFSTERNIQYWRKLKRYFRKKGMSIEYGHYQRGQNNIFQFVISAKLGEKDLFPLKRDLEQL